MSPSSTLLSMPKALSAVALVLWSHCPTKVTGQLQGDWKQLYLGSL